MHYNIYMATFLIIYSCAIITISFIAFFAYLSDKRRAIKHKWRIKESVLLGLSFFGGALGAMAAMILCRHKTGHWYFWAINFLSFVIQLVLPVAVCILYF